MRKQVVEKIASLMTAAFGLVAALAWNDAIKAIFKNVFGTNDAVGPMVGYAMAVTIIAVLAAAWIGRMSDKVNQTADIIENTMTEFVPKSENEKSD